MAADRRPGVQAETFNASGKALVAQSQGHVPALVGPDPQAFLNLSSTTALPMAILPLRGDHITLAQAVKAAGMAGTGGQAKHLVRQGDILVNDAVETQPGRKLFSGDRFRLQNGDEWTVSR